jgi:hypothetical protein
MTSTETLGLALDFQYQDFYAGIRAGDQSFHLKRIDTKDPSIDYVDHGDHFHLSLEVRHRLGDPRARDQGRPGAHAVSRSAPGRRAGRLSLRARPVRSSRQRFVRLLLE